MNDYRKLMEGHRKPLAKQAEDALESIVKFLELYLPLANAHATDFITKEFWNKLIPYSIQEELTQLPETDLKGLAHAFTPSEKSTHFEELKPTQRETELHTICHEDKTSALCQTKSALQMGNAEKNCSTEEYIVAARGTEGESFKDVEKSMWINWKHKTLNGFCIEAQKCTMENFGLVESYEKVLSQDLSKHKPFVGTYMSLKKSHEIERMSALCRMLVESFDSDLVIDFGSGKGYLGSYLSLRYNISVLGIDAVSINTKSAEHRTSVVAKQWNGLTRNKDRENSNVKLTKKEKKVLKGMGSYQKNGESVTYLSDKESTLSKADKYKSVTMFIENFTDLRRLIIAHFPELPHRQKSCNLESLSLSDAEHGTKDNKKGDFENLSEISDGSFAKPLDVSDYSQSHLMPKMDPITSNDKNHEIKSIQDNIEFNVKCLLTGLHTCGNLASTSLDLFVHSPDLKAICTVGCCYHLLTEEFSGTEKRTGAAGSTGFPMSSFLKVKQFHLGQTARNLASQSVNRLTQSELQGRRFFPRAVLEVLLQRLDVDSSVSQTSLRGLEQKSKSLPEFIARACEKYGISHRIDDKLITNLIQELADYEPKLAAFFQLRTVLAPCIESLIILDRVCFLLEQDNVKDVKIVEIFDPVKSPRCYAIIASKSDK